MQTLSRTPALPSPINLWITEASSYDYSQEVRNNLHPIIGRADVEVTLKPAGLRAGRLRLVMPSRADAFYCAARHAEVGVWSFTDSQLPEAALTYVTTGQIRCFLDPDSRTRWLVEVGFQEVIL
jgi:hypothetical protein